MAQLVRHLALAQVMISWFVSLSPASGSVLMGQSQEPALDSVSRSLSAPPPQHTHPLMLCLSLKNKHLKNFFRPFLFIKFLKLLQVEIHSMPRYHLLG